MLRDNYQRCFKYLRLSVTEVCDFRCGYCLPKGYRSESNGIAIENGALSIEEIKNLVKAFAEMGVSKIRLTGGEPTLRKDLLEVISSIRTFPEIQQVALTTNGVRLHEMVDSLCSAGLTHLNVSVDSLDPQKFKDITGSPRFDKVMAGIEKAGKKFRRVKINTVLLNKKNKDEVFDFVSFIQNRDMDVRFIELMETGQNRAYFREHHLSPQFIVDELIKRKWREVPRESTSGPARLFETSQESTSPSLGRVGVISPYSKEFCKSCNRLRVSSRGGLQLCLFGRGQKDLRPWLVSELQSKDLQQVIINSLQEKHPTHYLHEGDPGMTQTLSHIGG